MNKNNRLLRTGIAVALAALMAGASTSVLLTAMGLPCGAAFAYLPGLLAALLLGLGGCSGALAAVCAIAGAALAATAVAFNLDAFGALRAWAVSKVSADAALDAQTLTRAGSALAMMVSALLGLCLYALVSRRGGTMFALILYFAVFIGSYAMCESMSFGRAVPGLLAALAAFALSGEVARDAGAWRALIPVGLAVALAFLLVPSGRLTWAPLERAAQSVRAVFEDYFRFNKERVPFTISTEGYNHGAEIDGEVVTCLGGPANPSTDAVMQVTADADVLLRGAIRRTYTGYAWVDPDAKARYLYYDFTRRHVRESVFCMRGNEAFDPVNVSVEFLDTGTSSLFVPARMEELSMDMGTALYYNSLGEIFLSRPVEAGDAYALTGRQTGDPERVRAAVIAAQEKNDGDYAAILESCTQLPDTIEEGVYALAIGLTRDCGNAYDKAAAIQSWLRSNCTYTLTPDYPDYDRDFVSQFVLDDREGYCSYFASAMTVMCRIAGLPARYVEGYSIRTNGTAPVIVTGEDAHAWTEVYFSGLGWVAFDPANGSGGGSDGSGPDENDTADDENVPPPTESTPEPTATPAPTPTPNPDDGATPPPQDGAQDDPTPSPEPQSGESTPTPAPIGQQPDQRDEPDRDFTWLWILLAILLLLILIALAALWIRARLAATDPIRLSAKAKTAQQAAMILYRSILTLLAQTGQSPISGETPGAFARRVCAQTKNPNFIAFADGVAMGVYARAAINRQVVDAGRRAYLTFEKSMKRGERLRFTATRLFRGLGEFESIP